jgi:hypothetical protein
MPRLCARCQVGYSQSEQVARDPVSGIVYVVKTGATSLRLDLSLQPQGASASGGGVTKSGTTTAMSTARIAECEAVPAPEPEPVRWAVCIMDCVLSMCKGQLTRFDKFACRTPRATRTLR